MWKTCECWQKIGAETECSQSTCLQTCTVTQRRSFSSYFATSLKTISPIAIDLTVPWTYVCLLILTVAERVNCSEGNHIFGRRCRFWSYSCVYVWIILFLTLRCKMSIRLLNNQSIHSRCASFHINCMRCSWPFRIWPSTFKLIVIYAEVISGQRIYQFAMFHGNSTVNFKCRFNIIKNPNSV